MIPSHPARLPGASLAATAALVLSASLAGCESPAGEVSVLTSDTAVVVPGSTYAWAPKPADAQGADPRVDNDIIQGRIRQSIDTTLAAKGYRQVSDPRQAQLLVAYHVGLRRQTGYQVDTVGSPGPVACGIRGCIGYGWGYYGAPSAQVTPVDYTDGALMLDVIDRASGKLAWRAMSKKRVDKNDGAQAGLDAIVADMSKSLPGVTPPKAG